MKEFILDIPPQCEAKLSYASIGLRILAMVIDVVLEVSVIILITAFFLEGISDVTLFLILIPLFDFTYFVVLEASPQQGTMGKLITGIKVANERDERVSFVAAFGRYGGKIISWPLVGIGHLAALWDPARQALHDKIANSYVVNR